MGEANRFAPPTAAVDDAGRARDFQPVRLWPPTGRIGRLRFLAYSLGFYLVFEILSVALGAMLGALQVRSDIAQWIVGVGWVVLYVVSTAILLIQRSHDMDFSGWWSIAAFIPLVGLVWVFKAGTRGVNRWGAPPPPNGLAVRILGLLLPILLVGAIVAAIALPIVSGYSTRAGAAAPR